MNKKTDYKNGTYPGFCENEKSLDSPGVAPEKMLRKDFLKAAGVATAAMAAAAFGGLEANAAAPAKKAVVPAGFSPDYPLMPTGDSTTDTANLQGAFHDPLLDSGGTLYLGPGTFKIHRFIGRQNISDPSDPSYTNVLFNGTIQGAGKGVTVLKGVRGPGGVGFGPLHYEFPGFASDDHTLMAFVQTYVGVKDLTFESESELVDPYNLFGTRGLVNFLGLGSFVPGLNDLLGTDIANVHFKGSLDSSGDPETSLHFQQWGDKGGVHTVKNCEFENNSSGALEFWDLHDSVANIGGLPRDKVTFTNCTQDSIWAGFCKDFNVNVSRIETYDAAGVAFASNTDSRLTVLDSRINQRPNSAYAGVEVGQNTGGNVVISHNKISGEDAWLWGPIFYNGADGAFISNNKIEGNGGAGIYLISGANHTLQANNLNKFKVAPWGIAKIWLGYFDGLVTNSLVVGGNNHTNIYDSGYPLAGNIYTGVNNMQMNIGQDVKEAVNQKMQAKKTLMEQEFMLRRRGSGQ